MTDEELEIEEREMMKKELEKVIESSESLIDIVIEKEIYKKQVKLTTLMLREFISLGIAEQAALALTVAHIKALK